MEKVPIQHLKPGYIVAAPVKSDRGALLCTPGHRLTAVSIGRLQRAGVREVLVEGRRSTRSEIEQRLARLEDQFRDAADPALLEVKLAASTCLNRLRAEHSR